MKSNHIDMQYNYCGHSNDIHLIYRDYKGPTKDVDGEALIRKETGAAGWQMEHDVQS